MNYLTAVRDGERGIIHGRLRRRSGVYYRVKILGSGQWRLWNVNTCKIPFSETTMRRKRAAADRAARTVNKYDFD